MNNEDFNIQQSQVSLDVSDPRFIGGSLLKKFKDTRSELDLLKQNHNMLSRDVSGVSFDDNKYASLSRKLSLLEINNNFPNIEAMSDTYTKEELISMLSNLKWSKDYFLNIDKKIYTLTDTSTNPLYVNKDFLIVSQNGSATLIEKTLFDYYFTIPTLIFEPLNDVYISDKINGKTYQLSVFESVLQITEVNASGVSSIKIYDPSNAMVRSYLLSLENGVVKTTLIITTKPRPDRFILDFDGTVETNTMESDIENIDESMLKFVPEAFLQDFVEIILGDQTKTTFNIPEYVKRDIKKSMYNQKLDQLKASFGSDFTDIDYFIEFDSFIKNNDINGKLSSLIEIEQQIVFSGLVYIPFEDLHINGVPIGEYYTSLFYSDKNNNIDFKMFTDYKVENIVTRCLTYLNDKGTKVQATKQNLYIMPASYDGENFIIV